MPPLKGHDAKEYVMRGKNESVAFAITNILHSLEKLCVHSQKKISRENAKVLQANERFLWRMQNFCEQKQRLGEAMKVSWESENVLQLNTRFLSESKFFVSNRDSLQEHKCFVNEYNSILGECKSFVN